jgi:hypothetical protein
MPVGADCAKMKGNQMTNPSNRSTPGPATSPLFHLGDLVTTPGALSLLERYRINPLSLLARHLQGDWGSVPDEDRTANDDAVTLGNRIVSSYTLGEKDKVWIISEHDRSSTCILLPSEY